jgi:hypothetical protein
VLCNHVPSQVPGPAFVEGAGRGHHHCAVNRSSFAVVAPRCNLTPSIVSNVQQDFAPLLINAELGEILA